MASHVFATMGTVASLATREDVPSRDVLDDIERAFAGFDERFSLYRPSSELSRIAARELAMIDASEQLRDAYALSLNWREETRGAFTPHRPDGIVDLSGVVKALAMQAAVDRLQSAGVADFCLNVGGDIVAAGDAEVGTAWSVGIVDPSDRSSLLTSISLTSISLGSGSLGPGTRACATSGSAERGDHIWKTTDASSEFVQATVVADDIVTADVLATAIISGGTATLGFVTERWPIDVMTIDSAGAIRMTRGMRAAMGASSA